MRIGGMIGLIAALAAVGAFAQQPKQKEKEAEGARELYYFAVTKKDPLPPIRRVAATRTTQVAVAAPPSQRTDAPPPAASSGAPAGAVHLGFRYSLALVNSASGKSEAVDSDRVFQKGECLAIDFESNRSGYLLSLIHI